MKILRKLQSILKPWSPTKSKLAQLSTGEARYLCVCDRSYMSVAEMRKLSSTLYHMNVKAVVIGTSHLEGVKLYEVVEE